MNKFCTNCGKELKEGADICTNCGAFVNKKEVSVKVDNVDKNATTGFILGLVSIIAWFIPLFGYPVTICGIIFSGKGLKSNEKKTLAIIGLVLSILFLVVTLINSILGVIINTTTTYYYYY